jgi:ABC-type transport system involved in multi-copper enzyme maturation permease subunit
MLRQLLTIAHNTLTESIRQPIFTVLTLIAALALVLNVSLAAYSMETGEGDRKILVDMGLSTVFLAGILLAAFSATGVLSSEIEKRTVLTVVSKPVARPLFVIGKFLGVAAAIGLAYWILSLVLLATFRHGVMSTASDDFDMPVVVFFFGGALLALGYAALANYLAGKVFTSTFVKALAVACTIAFLGILVLGKEWTLQSPLTEFVDHRGEMTQVGIGLGLIFEGVLILTAVAIAVSTRLGQVMTLLICGGVFVIGLISNSLSGWVNQRLTLPTDLGVYGSLPAIASADVSLLERLSFYAAKAVYLISPNLQFLWPADAITQGHSLVHNADGEFTLQVIGLVTLYASLYTAVVLCIAIALFQRREVG